MVSTRVPGRGRLLTSLRLLSRRVERFAEHRASTAAERLWACRLGDDLDRAFAAAASTPGAREALAAVDERRASARKTRGSSCRSEAL